MKYNKLAVTIPNQIQILKQRGLIFTNESKAESYLSNISYYRLRAYTYPFQNNDQENHPFIGSITFEQIIELYVFDRKLRLLIFDAIEKIEIAFRTQIIYHFSLAYGSHWPTNPALYKNHVRFSNHLDSLLNEIDRSNETFIDHYKNKYTNPAEPPCWMSLEVISLGLLSKLFQNLRKGVEKNAITSHFGLNDFSILENWMLCFNTLRNICAHHGRVWNRRLIPIKLPTHPLNPFLKNNKVYNNKLYATLCCVEYVLKVISPRSTLGSRLKDLMAHCPLAQAKEMGFPLKWQDEVLWN